MRRMRMLALGLAVAALGCGGEPEIIETGARVIRVAPPVDAGVDAGREVIDAGQYLDAGHVQADAGKPDAGTPKQVAVTLQWSYPKRKPGACPTEEPATCLSTDLLLSTDLARVFSKYPGCSVAQTADTATIDCRANCQPVTLPCNPATNGYYDVLNCTKPAGVSLLSVCSWLPP